VSAGVSVCVTVPLAPAAAFRLFTGEVDLWWKHGQAYRMRAGSVMRFEGGEGGRLVEDFGGGREREFGRITAWTPGVRLAIAMQEPRFQEPVTTDVEVTFVAVAGGTRVTITHSGLERLLPGHPARHGLANQPFALMRGRWWQAQLDALEGRAGTS
jgi:uncharacterized protein YndB with AHSA1/START domain